MSLVTINEILELKTESYVCIKHIVCLSHKYASIMQKYSYFRDI